MNTSAISYKDNSWTIRRQIERLFDVQNKTVKVAVADIFIRVIGDTLRRQLSHAPDNKL